MKRYFTIILVVMFIFAFFACDSGSGGGGKTVITLAAIPGVTHPATGEIPVNEITPTHQYTGEVAWTFIPAGSPATTPPETMTDTRFMPNIVYIATITLKPRDHYTFDGVPENFFTVGTPNTPAATNPKGSGIVTRRFNVTGDRLNFADKTGEAPISELPIFRPAQGARVVTDFSNYQFTGKVVWDPETTGSGANAAFEPDKEYTAVITLEPRPTHTWRGVPANFFTISGARTVTNPVGNTYTTSGTTTNLGAPGQVHAIFYKFQTLQISARTLGNIVVKTGEEEPISPFILSATNPPLYTLHGQVKGTIKWIPSIPTTGPYTGKFEPEKEYRAVITLEALTTEGGHGTNPIVPYSLANLPTDFFSVPEAATAHFDSSTSILTAIFPKTGPAAP